MAMDPLVLVANPGTASRKYALYAGGQLLIKLHFEHEAGRIIYTAETSGGKQVSEPASISHLAFAAAKVHEILSRSHDAKALGGLKAIALRVVAPSSAFQRDRRLDDAALDELAKLEPKALLHINATLQEAHQLKKVFPGTKIIGISDSAFHKDKPDSAKWYGVPLDDQAEFDIQRYGYHGISVESVVLRMKDIGKLPKRLVVCHLGSGASITAVRNGKSIDTTMGYSPLEGLIMATRSGSIDISAAQVLQRGLGLDSQGLQDYLNNRGGLLGLSGESSDIRDLLAAEPAKDKAGLALNSYIHKVQQSIGAMAAELGGLDSLVFTGTVGERSAEIRRRVVKKLLFLGLSLDPHLNHTHLQPEKITLLSPAAHPAKIFVVPSDEENLMARRALKLIGD